MTEQPQQPSRQSLAYKLNRLFQTLHPAGRGEFTLQEVLDGIKAQGGPTLSMAYLWQLRNGVRDNPRKEHLEALAKFFGVNPAYFFDNEFADRIESQLDQLAAMRDAGVRAIALSASHLNSDEQQVVLNLIEQIGQLRRRGNNAPASASDSTKHRTDGESRRVEEVDDALDIP